MDYKQVNDYEQLYLIGENDDDSTNIIFQKYKPIVISLANKYYAKMNYHCGDLEDFIQEGYIGLARAIQAFKEQHNVLFYTFVLVCVERQLKAFCRKFSASKYEPFINSISMDYEQDENLNYFNLYKDESIINNPSEYLEKNMTYEKLIHFKNNLDLKHSLIFELRYNGFRYKEIAQLLDMPVRTVESCMTSCKKKLIELTN